MPIIPSAKRKALLLGDRGGPVVSALGGPTPISSSAFRRRRSLSRPFGRRPLTGSRQQRVANFEATKSGNSMLRRCDRHFAVICARRYSLAEPLRQQVLRAPIPHRQYSGSVGVVSSLRRSFLYILDQSRAIPATTTLAQALAPRVAIQWRWPLFRARESRARTPPILPFRRPRSTVPRTRRPQEIADAVFISRVPAA